MQIELRRADAPDEVSVWRTTSEGAADLPHLLRPKEEAGQVVAWVADVTLKVRRHRYIGLEAAWQEDEDPDGCRESVQATWVFHLEAKRRQGG